jgi:hypothetical protein
MKRLLSPLAMTLSLTLAMAGPFAAAQAAPQVDSADAMLYKEECGSCHIAYPARFLPEASWQNTMGTLDQHFGENAEIESDVAQQILRYLAADSADQRSARSKKRMDKQVAKLGHVPARITELPWHRGQHKKIPQKMTLRNPEVGSLSRCEACHKGAEQGKFNGRVSIPGFGRWVD